MPRIDRRWGIAALAMVCLIWGNSLVPGSGSGSLSLSVMDAIHGFLAALGLPYAWVTNFVVRKCAHFTEYMVLGIIATHAFDIEGKHRASALVATAVFLVAVPSIDETIQLFIPGRSGMVRDVLIDCAGATTGVVLRYLVRRVLVKKKAA